MTDERSPSSAIRYRHGGPRCLALLAGLLLSACAEPAPQRAAPSRVSSTEATFPPDTWPVGIHSEMSDRVSRVLAIMGEPRLFLDEKEPHGEVQRLVWLRTFHHPMAVRLVRADSGCRVVLTILSGKGGADLGVVQRRDSSVTADARCAEVEATLTATGFGSDTLTPGLRRNDGAEWVFESRGAAGYRVVARWSPEVSRRDPKFALAGRAFLRIASWDEAADDPIY